jgi:hypothetical protein
MSTTPAMHFYRPGRRGGPPPDDFRKKVRNGQLALIRDRQRNRRLTLFSLVATLLFFSLVVLFWARVENRRLDYEIARLETLAQQLEDRTAGLRGDVSSARSLEIVRRTAVTDIGLVEPAAGQVVHYYVESRSAALAAAGGR